jgi:hypothetical protein
MKKAIMLGGVPDDVKQRLKSVKIELQAKFSRNVPYWEVLQYLLALYDEQKHIAGSKQIFPHIEG